MSNSSAPVYLVSMVRTPIGKYGGALASVRPDDMAAFVLRALLQRTGVDAAEVDDVILGCANQAGEDNRNIARMALLLAGFPYTVPGVTVNRLCASSLEAAIQGMRAIRSNEADVVVVGGVESMSRAPFSFPKNAQGTPVFGNVVAYDTALGWRYPNLEMEKMFPLESMGETAENVAEKYGITRQAQDIFAVESHRRAIAAISGGVFQREIVPYPVAGKKGVVHLFDTDELPRSDTTVESLARLKPAFRAGGTVTAGNSSALNDGAVALLLCSERALAKHHLTPLTEVVSSAAVGVDPRYMGIGPVGALAKACGRAEITIEQLELVELNEAFAAQALACIGECSLSRDHVNIHGGAIALGHPLGMSGGRILGTLAYSMQERSLTYGAAALCIGVGQGLAVVLKRT
jgi:3-oxoadipyl-CoA thiolase